MIRSFLVMLMMALCVTACKNKTLPTQQLLTSLRNMSHLATVEYTVTKVVKANDNKTWFKPGDRKILITTEAVLTAGIDLSKLQEKDFQRNGKSITLWLPEPELLSLNMPASKAKVVFEQRELLRYPFSSAERDALMQQAEEQIREDAPATGILEQAKTNTQLVLTNFLTAMGFDEVNLRYRTNETPQTKG